jgi:hypothetical protein
MIGYMIQRIVDFFHIPKVSADTKVTLIVTIMVFGLGFVFSWISKQLKDYTNRKLYRSSIVRILKDFSVSCHRLTVVVNKSLESASLIHGKDFNISYVPIGTLEQDRSPNSSTKS